MLSARLRSLRKEKKISQEYMAEKLGMTRQGYGHYETGRNEPDSDTLIKISDILDCSTDYLHGKTENVRGSTYDPIHEINHLLKKYNIDQSGFFDIEKWKAMGPEEIRELESYFEFITSRAKEKNLNDDKKGS